MKSGTNDARLWFTVVLQRTAPHLRLTEIHIEDATWRRRVGVSYRKDGYLSPAARRFIEILKATAKDIAKEP